MYFPQSKGDKGCEKIKNKLKVQKYGLKALMDQSQSD